MVELVGAIAAVVAALFAGVTLFVQFYWRRPQFRATLYGVPSWDGSSSRIIGVQLTLTIRNDGAEAMRDVCAELLIDGIPKGPPDRHTISRDRGNEFYFHLRSPEEAEYDVRDSTISFHGKAATARVTCGRHTWLVPYGASELRLAGTLRSGLLTR